MMRTALIRNLVRISMHTASVAALSLSIVCTLVAIATPSAEAQSFSVIHSFTGGLDGDSPLSGLARDLAGNIYGANYQGGNYGGNCGTAGCGAVYRLSHRGTGWTLTPLYDFTGGNDGSNPSARVVIGPDGSLYGTTLYGGGGPCQSHGNVGCGTVFRLQPPPNACVAVLCPWRETVVYRFSGASDGKFPGSEVTFDQAGNMYGTAGGGTGACSGGCGVVYKLSPSSGGWTETVIYNFAGGSDGRIPLARVIFDQSGNLYGTTVFGGSTDSGTVFQLTPSGSAWTERILYNFTGGTDGANPQIGVIFDGAGNAYGAASSGGQNGGGTVFQLVPQGGNWNFVLLHSFTGLAYSGPGGDLVFHDASLYGTTSFDGPFGNGNIFELTPSGGGWTYASLYEFQSNIGGSYSNVVFDANGNGYGSAQGGGSGCAPLTGCGVIWEITP